MLAESAEAKGRPRRFDFIIHESRWLSKISDGIEPAGVDAKSVLLKLIKIIWSHFGLFLLFMVCLTLLVIRSSEVLAESSKCLYWRMEINVNDTKFNSATPMRFELHTVIIIKQLLGEDFQQIYHEISGIAMPKLLTVTRERRDYQNNCQAVSRIKEQSIFFNSTLIRSRTSQFNSSWLEKWFWNLNFASTTWRNRKEVKHWWAETADV